MKKAGWPAIDGMFSILELPSPPWQAAQVWMRSASGVPCASAAPKQKAAAANPKASGRPYVQANAITPALPAGCFALIGNAIDRTILFVRHQQRSVLQEMHIGRPAVECISLLVKQAGHERLDLGLAARGPRYDNVVAEF